MAVNSKPSSLHSVVIATIAASSVVSINIQAQELEEIVVTAQRREQSLQQVPVSVAVFSGEQIELQGFKNLDDLARMSATVNMSDGTSGQNTTIRGFGTAGNSMTLQSATPLFVDGIHFGSLEMVKNAFMDTDHVEVLMGPQPLHFGMDASAGAFTISSKRPTEEYEGDIASEFGNDGKREISGAFGGPITDTLGFRVAVAHDKLDGLLKHRYDDSKFPRFDSLGGRAMLQWKPNDSWNVVTKFEINRQRNGGEIGSGCIAEGSVRGYSVSPVNGSVAGDPDFGIQSSVYVPASEGGLSNSDRLGIRQFDPKYTGEDCFEDEYGISRNGPYAKPIITNMVKDSTNTIFDGYADTSVLMDNFHKVDTGSIGVMGIDGIDGKGNKGTDDIDSNHGIIDITYEFGNGMTLNSQTAYVDFLRSANADSGNSPFADSNQYRRTRMDQHSQQFRLESPSDGYDINVDMPGGLTMNFMLGGYYQQWDKDVFINNIRAVFLRGQRMNQIWEDAKFLSGFWGMDLNFMDEQLSLQMGGRYSDVNKQVFLQGFGAALIFDKFPCDSAGTDANPATCAADPDFKRVSQGLTTFTIIDPITGRGGTTGTAAQRITRQVRVDSPRIFLQGVDGKNLWTQNQWNVRAASAVPLNWRGAQAQAVGLTAPVYANVPGPYGDCEICTDNIDQGSTNYSSQIVLSYTPKGGRLDGNHTFYGKYAEGYKGPVTDTGTSTLPPSIDDIYFTPEYSKSYEVGGRGSLLDGKARYSLTGFRTRFTDLQSEAAVASFDPSGTDQQGISLNAGSVKVDGAEMNLDMAVTDRLVVNLASSLINARYGEFDGTGCTDSEIIAASINAVENPASRSAAEIVAANTFLNNMGPERRASLPRASEIPESLLANGGCRLVSTPAFAAGTASIGGVGTFNRAGLQPAFAPDYKIVMGATYTIPVLTDYEIVMNAQGYIEDEKTVLADIMDRSRQYNAGHWDVNLMTGFGPQDGTWQLVGFVRNLMEDRIVFNQEYDLSRSGIVFSDDRGISKASFQSYGVRFQYHYE